MSFSYLQNILVNKCSIEEKDVHKKQRKEAGLILQSRIYIFFLLPISLKGTVFFFRVLQTNETLKSKPRGKRGVLPIMDYIGRGAFFGLQLFTC